MQLDGRENWGNTLNNMEVHDMTKAVFRGVVSMVALRDNHGMPTKMRICFKDGERIYPITNTFEWIHDDVTLESYVIVRN